MGGAAVAILLQAGMLWVLIMGLGVTATRHTDSRIAIFAIAPEPPPPPPVIPPKHRTKGKEGAASPPNIKSTATEVYAPKPVIPPVTPPPIAAAPKPNVGIDPSQGAAPVQGPGTGAGGIGNGTGSGGNGDGDGGGGDGTPPRMIKGRLKFSDLPAELADAEIGGEVGVRYAVETDGRVDDCRITKSSGDKLLDQTTCRLIEERFRFKPSLDEDGEPVRSYIVESHSWEIQREPPEEDRRRR